MESPERHRWTVEDVLRMLEVGLLRDDEPLELLDGDLWVVSPQGPPHSMAVVRVRRRLERAFGDGYFIQDHSPVVAGRHSLPEPDVAVVREPMRFDRLPTAAETALVVELSVSTQRTDREKAAIYAAGGFAEYWNLDLVSRRLTVYQQPRPEQREYARVSLHREEDVIRAGAERVPVADLLPPP